MEKMGLKEIFQKILEQFRSHGFIGGIKRLCYLFLKRERRKRFGDENEDRTIYVIRSLAENSPFYIGPVHNLLANFFYVISHIQYAHERGWIPVVDELNYPVYNSQDEPINGSKNPWEYFWEQPGGVSLEKAYKSKNVVLSKQSWVLKWDMGYDLANYQNPEIVAFYHELTETAPLNETMKKKVDDAFTHTIPVGRRILGVNVRIGGHAKAAERHGKGHPIQPEIEELIQIVKKRKNEWNMEYVFLACEADSAVKCFRESFGDKLIIYKRRRALEGTENLLDREKNLYAPGNVSQTAMDYLTEMELLSRCDALIGSITSGFRYALVRNGGRYEHFEIIDRGRFAGRY